MRKATRWHAALVRPPAELGWRNSLFIEAFTRPGVDELAHLFWFVGKLRVALGDLDDLRAARLRNARMRAIRKCAFKFTLRRAAHKSALQQFRAKLLECELRLMAHPARIRAMFKDGAWAIVRPP